MKKGALFCLKGFIREPKPTKKGIRVLLGILDSMVSVPSSLLYHIPVDLLRFRV